MHSPHNPPCPGPPYRIPKPKDNSEFTHKTSPEPPAYSARKRTNIKPPSVPKGGQKKSRSDTVLYRTLHPPANILSRQTRTDRVNRVLSHDNQPNRTCLQVNKRGANQQNVNYKLTVQNTRSTEHHSEKTPELAAYYEYRPAATCASEAWYFNGD